MVRKSLGIVSALACAALFTASSMALGADAGAPLSDRNPTGQSTYLKVETGNSARTSGMIRSGEFRRVHAGHDLATQTHQLKTSCKIDVRFMGAREGAVSSNSPEYFFSAAFVEALRASQILELPDMKIKHLGYKDATTMDGHQYAGADEILLYDIDTANDASGFGVNCLSQMMINAGKDEALAQGMEVDEKAGMQNLQVRVLLHPDAPIFGEVKLDATGVYSGMNIKVGGDYMAGQ